MVLKVLNVATHKMLCLFVPSPAVSFLPAVIKGVTSEHCRKKGGGLQEEGGENEKHKETVIKQGTLEYKANKGMAGGG